MAIYTGKEICQACRKTGEERPRYRKDRLCTDCEKLYNLGIAKDVEFTHEYVNISKYCSDYYPHKDLDKFAEQVLSIFHNPLAPYESRVFLKGYKGGENSCGYKVPKTLVEPLRTFFEALYTKLSDVDKELKQMPEKIEQKVAEEKNKIYNEGVEAGRNLLIALHRGDLTLDDFNKNINKY